MLKTNKGIVLGALAAAIIIHGIAADKETKKNIAPLHQWKRGASLQSPRAASCAVALADGRIVVAGGSDETGALNSVEVGAVQGDFAAAQAMGEARADHACVVLQNGLLLVAGGSTSGGGITNSAELYDADANKWTAAGPMSAARAGATATLLKDGRVLITGGRTAGAVSNTVEIFDPETSRFTALHAT